MASTIPNGKHAAVNAKLTESTFTDVCLGGAKFDDVNLGAAAFHNVNLTGARFDDVNLSGVAVTNANLDGMTIDGVLVTELLAAYRRWVSHTLQLTGRTSRAFSFESGPVPAPGRLTSVRYLAEHWCLLTSLSRSCTSSLIGQAGRSCAFCRWVASTWRCLQSPAAERNRSCGGIPSPSCLTGTGIFLPKLCVWWA